MNIENTYDEVLLAALHGLQPDEEDLARIRIPAGEDEVAFLETVQQQTKAIAEQHRIGANGEARKLAEQAQQEYLGKFTALMPIPAGGEDIPITDLGARIFGTGSNDLTDTANRMFRS